MTLRMSSWAVLRLASASTFIYVFLIMNIERTPSSPSLAWMHFRSAWRFAAAVPLRPVQTCREAPRRPTYGYVWDAAASVQFKAQTSGIAELPGYHFDLGTLTKESHTHTHMWPPGQQTEGAEPAMRSHATSSRQGFEFEERAVSSCGPRSVGSRVSPSLLWMSSIWKALCFGAHGR